jgi:hypothetical protein
MTYRRLGPVVLSAVLAGLVLGPSVGTPYRFPSARSSAGRVPVAGPSPRGGYELVQEIARDAVVGPPGSEPDTAVESYVATDPAHQDVAVAVFQEGRFPDGGASAIGFAASDDGGRTWVSGVLPRLTRATGGPYLRASDPSVTFGPDGTAYASSIVLRGPRGEGIAVNRSDDGGRTWGPPVLLQRDPPRSGDDFPRIAADTGLRSIYAGRVYVTFVRHDHVVLRWSDDRATTWSVMAAVSAGRGFVPNLLVGPDGAITVLYINAPPDQRPRVFSRTSHDGGASFDSPVELGAMRPHVSKDWRAGGVEESAVDPVTGTLYAAWEDSSSRENGLNEVVLVRSVDGGATWSPPTPIAGGSAAIDEDRLMPVVAAVGNRVHVAYFARAVTAGKPSSFVTLRSVSSSNGGMTFAGERSIGQPADLRLAAVVRPDGTRFLGDYFGVAFTRRALLVVWTRSGPPPGKNGRHVTVWAAAIPVAGSRVLRP